MRSQRPAVIPYGESACHEASQGQPQYRAVVGGVPRTTRAPRVEARAASKDPLPRGLAWRRGLYQPERGRWQRGAGCWLRVSGSVCGLDGGWASLVASVPRCFGRRRWAPCACKLPSTACPSPVLADGAARTRRARPACSSARACCQRRYGSVPSTAAPIVRIPRVARLDTKSCCGW